MLMEIPPQVPNTFSTYMVAGSKMQPLALESKQNRLGTCREVLASEDLRLWPLFDADFYAKEFGKGPNVNNDAGKFRPDIDVRVAVSPKHGFLRLVSPGANDFSKYDFLYRADKSYVGKDSLVVTVTVDGTALQINYRLMIAPADADRNSVGFCKPKKESWKIASNTFGLVMSLSEALP